MSTIRNRIEGVLGDRDYFRAFLHGELSRTEYLGRLMNEKDALLGAGLNEDQIHLSARFPQNEDAAVNRVLGHLVECGVLPDSIYDREQFAAYRDLVDECFDHGGYNTYIFPEEAHLLYALCQILQPKDVVFLGSYYGYWATWAMPAIRGAGGHAWLLDIDAAVNQVSARNMETLGFSEHATILTSDAVEFMQNRTEPLDLAVIDPEGPLDDPRPEYRGKSLYYPLARECARVLRRNGVIVCHNVIRRNLTDDWYFDRKIDQYKAEYSRFFPFVEHAFEVCGDHTTTEGVGIYARPKHA